MKHNKKVNPLTHFNNLKAAAVKKAGGEMSKYKKSLKKAQAGTQVNNNIPDEYKDYERFSGPLRENQAKKLDRILGSNTPMISSPEEINKYKNIRDTQEVFMRNAAPGRNYGYENFNFQEDTDSVNKKGGAVKKMSKGGSLKPVPGDKVGLSKLPTPVRNKMGYQKKGGSIKRK